MKEKIKSVLLKYKIAFLILLFLIPLTSFAGYSFVKNVNEKKQVNENKAEESSQQQEELLNKINNQEKEIEELKLKIENQELKIKEQEKETTKNIELEEKQEKENSKSIACSEANRLLSEIKDTCGIMSYPGLYECVDKMEEKYE